MGREVDMRAFKRVIQRIGRSMKEWVGGHTTSPPTPLRPKILVNKSTVPIGTTKLTKTILNSELASSTEEYFTVASMPEFLAEGQAVANLTRPERIVIGTEKSAKGDYAFGVLKGLAEGSGGIRIIHTREASSELGKLLSNAMLAQRLSSINSLASLAEKFDNCDLLEVK